MNDVRIKLVLLLFFIFATATISNAEVIISPYGGSVGLENGEESSSDVTLTNTDESLVNFKIIVRDPPEEEERDELRRSVRRILGAPYRDRRGDDGEDDGYEWRDSDEDDGPEYEWIDIRDFFDNDQITVMQFSDDQNHGPFDLDFEIEYYGNVYDEIRMCSNGWASFNDADGGYYWLPRDNQWPSDDGPTNALCVARTDWDPGRDGGTFLFATDGEIAVCSWINNPHIGGGGSWTFQIVLYDNGFIKFQYQDVDANVGQWLVGYQNANKQIGALAYRGGPGYPENELAIGIGTAEMFGPAWLMAEPDEGDIAAGESLDIELIIAPVDMEDGIYESRVVFELSNGEDEDADQWFIETSVVLSVSSPTINVTGIITDPADDDAVISDVRADLDQYIISRFSNDDGAFEFADLPSGDYELTFTAEDYLPFVQAVEPNEEGDDVELEISLLHSECNPNVDGLQNEIAPEEMAEVSFRIDNDGNGPLTYITDRRLIGDANADPYTVRAEVLAGQANDDSHIRGVMFANDRFYISGSNDNEPVIYVHNRDGEHLETFEQPGEDRNGMRDLAFDGELLWGPSGDRIFGLSLDGEVQADLESPFNLTGCLAYDPDLDVLWVAYTTTNIVMMDREGNIQGDFGRQGLRMNGFAYWPDDPDGYNLYIYNMFDDGDGRRPALHKMNTEDGDIMFVSFLETERGGNSLGCYITNQYDIYSWVMIAAVTASDNQGGDRIDIWQVDARREWMLLDPTEGVIEPDESQEFTLTYNATGLPAEQFRGEIVFTHDGVGGETIIPLTLNVVEGPVHTIKTLDLHRGWNMVSVYLQPDEEEIEVLLAPLVEQDLLLIMKNSDGEFYRPDAGFNNIDMWNVDEGYLLKLSDPGDLPLEGTTVLSDEPIDLEEGWQMVSCYLRFPVDATIAFSNIAEQMLIAKDEDGNFYIPEFNFSNMGNVSSLNGYQLKMSEDAELIYRFQMDEDEGDGVYSQRGTTEPSRLGVHANTGSNMSLLVLSNTDISGDIGVYAYDVLVGSGVITDNILGISIWGDDLSTEAIDGAIEGAELELRLYDGSIFSELTYMNVQGDGSYATDALWVVELTGAKALPTEFGIDSVYPNPFNSRTLVRFGLSDASATNVRLYDLSGRLLRDISLGRLSAGGHTMTIDGADLSSGLYILELFAGADVSRRKLTLVK